MSTIVSETTAQPAATRMRVEPSELDIYLSHEGGGDPHHIGFERSYDLSAVAVKALPREGGSVETGTVLVRLGVDGDGLDKVLAEVAPVPDSVGLAGVLCQAREAIAHCLEALYRVDKSAS